MRYREDIDGLRAIAVLSVVAFHSAQGFLPGGYIGVDIFFVISGYLITGLIIGEVQNNSFTYSGFYKRRAARLLPALIITLVAISLFGFLFYNNQAYDNLGKEIFFSAFGVSNFLFAQGVDYFAQDESVRPLLHLWSLGVEEQFYLVWPTILLMFRWKNRNLKLLVVVALLLISLGLSVADASSEPKKAFFYPQYRAFELLIGAAVAFVIHGAIGTKLDLTHWQKSVLTFIALCLMLAPMYLLDSGSAFPGWNALWPCLGAGLYILFAEGTLFFRILSFRPLVFIGLVSYPLYLFHHPIISYMKFFDYDWSPLRTFSVAMVIAFPLSAMTYWYIEKPIRRACRLKPATETRWTTGIMVVAVASIGLFGLFVAKNSGIGWRFQLLNPFAYEVTEASATTFHSSHSRGAQVSDGDKGRILFVGDSALQQYVVPISMAFGIDSDDVDTVTRGGCVLLKGVDFYDRFSDISCDSVRERLYKSDKRYDYVVLSQQWWLYDDDIRNAQGDRNSSDFTLQKWTDIVEETIDHFGPLSNRIILIGSHPMVEGVDDIQPTIFLDQDEYTERLDSLSISNSAALQESRTFFEGFVADKTTVIHPRDLFCTAEDCKLHDDQWSYFSDKQHLATSSTPFIVSRLGDVLSIEGTLIDDTSVE